MMHIEWHRQHRWSSIATLFFLAVFCLSGVVLNHRETADRLDVPRSVLPPFYRHEKWNLGLLRGSLSVGDSVIVYGSGGMWLTDTEGRVFSDFNHGMPHNAAGRHTLAMAQKKDGSLLALSPTAFYTRNPADSLWRNAGLETEERLSDLILHGDSTIVIGRSHLFISPGKGKAFVKKELRRPEEPGFGRTTAFRTVWMLHSGELFGLPGRLVADALAVVMLALCLTGMSVWLIPKRIRRCGAPYAGKWAQIMKSNLRWHDRIGRFTIVFTLLIVLTGWALRPPLLIALAQWKVPPMPKTALDSENPWHDRLRMMRFDTASGRWLLSTSEGIYALESLESVPEKQGNTPPVSVMGINVFEPAGSGKWIVGSFSGLYVWDAAAGKSVDYFTGETAPEKAGPPFGKKAVAGFSRDFKTGDVVALYDEGTDALHQPEELETLPMPLWNCALEAHTGRLFFGNSATFFYVFIVGGIILWSLVSGFKVRRRNGRRGR